MERIWQLIWSYGSLMLGVAGALLLLGTILMVHRRLEHWFDKVWAKFRGTGLFTHGKLNKATQNVISNLNSDLSALRGEFKADRAYIFEFHNGSQFASKLPQWKISQTYEKVRNGITHEGGNLQNIYASLIWDDFLKVFFITSAKEKIPQGFTKYVNTPACKIGCILPRTVYLITVNDMDLSLGPVKAMLQRQGIYYMLVTPIMTIHANTIGFIGLDYCGEDDLENLNVDSCSLCRFASQVALAWEMDSKTKDRMLTHQKKLWDDDDKT